MLPFSQTLWLWRVDRGLTQEALARRAGISRPNLSAIETGKREVSLRTLRALAAALEIPPGLLADGTGPVLEKSAIPLSRAAMERIADGVVRRVPAATTQRLQVVRPPLAAARTQERILVNLLREILKHRLSSAGPLGILRGGKRRMDAAWLLLNGSYPPEVIRSLVQRIEDRLRLT
ncbi:MAG: helix-turn-helix domain-containing protein [Candidatus Omnitrophica bacterium]|nr:helix-turn-helix domain-containing protein [Candidatus Omnitrophota bacterium]